MIFALLTLLAALALAAVSGWFSIIGIMSIYAGAAFHALVMGAVLEGGKLVTTSWLYRNWDYANWKLKVPLIVFTITLMIATSIGVFGFLSKAHLEQGAGTVDNTAKVERLDQQITREKSVIADDEKVIAQLDATINSYIGKDRTDRSVAVRRSQAPQRKQLREDIDASQKKIDQFSDEKFRLQSEVRKLQLDVGPIRYIAALVYGTDGNTDKNIESAVQIFTLIIVSTLDPLAVILLIAANHTLVRYQNEKEEKTVEGKPKVENRPKFRYRQTSSPEQADGSIFENNVEGQESPDATDTSQYVTGTVQTQLAVDAQSSSTISVTEENSLPVSVLPGPVELSVNEEKETLGKPDEGVDHILSGSISETDQTSSPGSQDVTHRDSQLTDARSTPTLEDSPEPNTQESQLDHKSM